MKFALGKTENIVRKRRKCWFPAFVLFPQHLYPRKTNVFGVYWNQPVTCAHLCVIVSIRVQNTSLCQSAGGVLSQIK